MNKITIEGLGNLINNTEDFSTIPNDKVTVKLNKGSCVLNLREAVVHYILWKPLIKYGVKITEDDIYKIYPMTTNTIAKNVQSLQYAKLIEINDDTDAIIYDLWACVYEVYAMCFCKLSEYTESIDLVDFINILKNKKLDDIIRTPIDTDKKSIIAENDIKQRGDKLLKLLSTDGAIPQNQMINFIQSGVFKPNQVVQLMLALGSRSDIDDKVLPHVMTCSSLSGMSSIKDMCTESTSSKKTTHFNSTIIKDVQSWHREMRLYTCNLNIKYRGDCGNRNMIKVKIPKGHGINYIDKIVSVMGELIAVTEDNYKDIEDKNIEVVSPIFCKHVNGVCEHCAGRATNYPWKYIPDIRLGGYGTSVICSKGAQKVLSAKHLIKVVTIAARLTGETLKYFSMAKDYGIKLDKSKLKNTNNKYLMLPIEGVAHLTDLGYEGLTPQGFGQIRNIGIYDKTTGSEDMFDLTEDSLIQHCSKELLAYMHRRIEDIEIREEHYLIPLDKYNSRQTMFDIVELNDDMKAYVRRIRKLFKSGVAECPNVHMAFSLIANMIHNKMNVNVFFIELVIKSIINGVVPDDGTVSFNKLNKGIANFNVATKLGHGWVKNYLRSPEITALDKGPSPFDALYGFDS